MKPRDLMEQRKQRNLEMESMIKSIKTKEKLLNDIQNEDVASNLKNLVSFEQDRHPSHLGKPSRGQLLSSEMCACERFGK